MTLQALITPVAQFFGTDGQPLSNGRLYFGVENLNPETNPVTVYWDKAGTQPAAQPIITKNGYATRNGLIARVYIDGAYSLSIRASDGTLVYYNQSSFTGDDSQDFVYQNLITITRDVAIRAGYNGMSAGPISIADGVTVTIPTGSAWSII